MPHMYEPIPDLESRDHPFGGLEPLLTKSLALFMGLRAQTVVQRGVTNCPLPALLAAMAHAMPGRLRAMIKMLPVRTPRTSSFFEVPEMARGVPNFTSNVIFSVDFQHSTVEVTPILFVDGKNRPRFAMSTDRGGWVSYIEKAYVVYRCKYVYSNLNFLGGSATPLTVARVVEDVAHAFDWYSLRNGNCGGILTPSRPTRRRAVKTARCSILTLNSESRLSLLA